MPSLTQRHPQTAFGLNIMKSRSSARSQQLGGRTLSRSEVNKEIDFIYDENDATATKQRRKQQKKNPVSSKGSQRRYTPQQILSKSPDTGKYLVKWEDGSVTHEPRENISDTGLIDIYDWDTDARNKLSRSNHCFPEVVTIQHQLGESMIDLGDDNVEWSRMDDDKKELNLAPGETVYITCKKAGDVEIECKIVKIEQQPTKPQKESTAATASQGKQQQQQLLEQPSTPQKDSTATAARSQGRQQQLREQPQKDSTATARSQLLKQPSTNQIQSPAVTSSSSSSSATANSQGGQQVKGKPNKKPQQQEEQNQSEVDAATKAPITAATKTVTPKESSKRRREEDSANDCGKKAKVNQEGDDIIATTLKVQQGIQTIGMESLQSALSALENAKENCKNTAKVAFHTTFDNSFYKERNKTLAFQQKKINAARHYLALASNIEEKAALLNDLNKEIVEMKRLQAMFNDIKMKVSSAVYQEVENRVMQSELVAEEAAKERRAGRLEGVVVGVVGAAVASAGFAAIGFFI